MRQKVLNVFLVTLLCLTSAFAQQTIRVTGKVVDNFGESMPGVNVQVKGTTIGSITDVDGNFSVNVPNSKSVLLISFIGYVKEEIPVGKQTKINVTLKEDSQNLDEVVVIGYGNARKSDLTGAATSLRPDANEAMKSTSLSSLLQGKVAGINITASSATPGAAASIIIRGANSLRGDNQPLYVIDNIPQSSAGQFSSSAFGGADVQIAQDPMSGLNPADIEDITVLKDASATAIYGSRGANGVILITTKRGKAGKAQINVSANYTISQPRKLLDMMNLNDFATYANTKVNPGEEKYYLQPNGEMRYVYGENLAKYKEDPTNPEYYRVITNRNWQKEGYVNSLSQQYAVSASGGSDAFTYYISASFKDINGIVKNSGMKQGDLRANLIANLSKRVTLTLAMNGSLTQNNMLSGGNTSQGVAGSFSRTVLDNAPYRIPDDDPSLQTNVDAKTTVFSWIDDYEDITDSKNFNASLELKWKITDYLSYNLRTGGGVSTDDRKRWYGMQLTLGANENGLLGTSALNKSNYTVENMLNFNKKFGRHFKVGAMAALTYSVDRFLNETIKASQFSNKSFRTKGLHMASVLSYNQPVQKDFQLLSYLGRVNLGWDDKYLLTASVRADGSSKFKRGNRWATFPSFSLAWRMEQEEFLKSVEFISQLKLRAGYGETGSQGIQPYSTFSDYAHLVDYSNADNILAQAVSNLQNDKLKWERTSSWNTGLDFGFFNGRLSGTVDFYWKKTKDLLISRTLPTSSGFNSVMINQGSLSNKGAEVTLDGTIIRSKNWTWSIGGNIGFNRSEINDLGLAPADFGTLKNVSAYLGTSAGDHFGGSANIFVAGMQPGLFYGYKTQGIVQKEDIVDGKVAYIAADGSTKYYKSSTANEMLPGSIKAVDMNEDGVIDENDKTVIGNPNPDFTYGFQTRLTYKGLSLSAQFNGVSGRELFNANARYNLTPSRQSGNLLAKAFRGMWTENNPSNEYPSSNINIKNVIYDRYIEDASFLRCSDITLAYDLPKTWMRKIGFQNVNISASGKNLFVITKYNGYDPEVGSFAFDGGRPGYDYSSFPSMRSFIFGLNVTF